MVSTIINKLKEIYPAYNGETFDESALLEKFFFVVEMGDIEKIGSTSHQLIHIYIYTPSGANFMMKGIKDEVINELKNKHFKTSEGVDFWIEYDSELFTKIDHTIDKKCKCLQFKVPVV
ncbi:MAG: hypothetical protein ACTTKH_04425 [Treponema sp.]